MMGSIRCNRTSTFSISYRITRYCTMLGRGCEWMGSSMSDDVRAYRYVRKRVNTNTYLSTYLLYGYTSIDHAFSTSLFLQSTSFS